MYKNREFFGCCCDVALGTKVIAILGIFGNIVLFINGCFSQLNYQNEYISDETTYKANVGLACADLLFNVSLFYGAAYKKRAFILAWIIKQIVALVLFAFIAIVLFVILVNLYLQAGLIFLILSVIIFAIYTHIVVCVNHYYKQLENTQKNAHHRLYAMSA